MPLGDDLPQLAMFWFDNVTPKKQRWRSCGERRGLEAFDIINCIVCISLASYTGNWCRSSNIS